MSWAYMALNTMSLGEVAGEYSVDICTAYGAVAEILYACGPRSVFSGAVAELYARKLLSPT